MARMAEPRRSPAPIRLLQVTAFVSTFDRFAMPPLLVTIAADLDASLSSVVQAAGVYFLTYGLLQPVWGAVSDRLGLVRTMRLTLLLGSIATIASAAAPSVLLLAVSRACAGGFFASAYPSSLIYLGDTVAPEQRQRAITRLMVGVALGTASASVGSGLLADLSSWRLAFVLTGLTGLATALALRRLPEPGVHRSHANLVAPLRAVVRSRATVFVLLLAFVEGAVLLGVLTLLPAAVEASGSSAALAGAVTGIYGVSVYLAATLVGRLSRTHHPARLIALGATSALLASAVMAVAQSPWAGGLAAALLGLGWASMHSSLQTWATEVLPGVRATVVSLFAGALFVGSSVAAVLVSDLAEAGRYGTIFLVATLLTLPLGVAATGGRARWRRARPDGSGPDPEPGLAT